jgi:sulfur-oxidizing protein SoxZ
MATPVARVRVPETAAKGEIVTLRAVITHPMETGRRRDEAGDLVPRRIIARLDVTFEGRPAFSAAFEPAVSANPFIEFHVRVEESGTFRFSWLDEDGSVHVAEDHVSVV